MNKKHLTTAAFVVIVGGVIALFAFLGGQDHPPDMPRGTPQHKLRFNLKNDLIGIETDPPVDPLAASTAAGGFVYDKRAVEEHINKGCQQCHGAPSVDLSTHACASSQKEPGGARCIGEHHPPKTECIKCHREAH